MGTRADFYVGRGKQAEWLGSIAWDGYPDGIDKPVLEAKTEPDYRKAVTEFLANDRNATLPAQGWPWPWEDSGTTDYSYAFDAGEVWGTCFGYGWWPALNEPKDDNDERKGKVEFPDMSERKNVTFGARSGVMVLRTR